MQTEPKFEVIVCGSLHLDIVVTAPAIPRLDETAVGSGWKKVCGGKGGNQAVQAARAGARTAMIGRIGRDDFGETLVANLKAANVDVSVLSVDTVSGTGMSVAILQDDGDYGAVIVSGANLTIDPATFHESWQHLGGARVLVLQNEVPHAVNVAAARAAKADGAQVLFNAAPARDVGRDLLDRVDVLILNRVEAEAMLAAPVSDRASARRALDAAGKGWPAMVVTLGGDGLVLRTLQGDVTEIEPIAVKATSTHGAGDCFVGHLAARLAAADTLQEASLHANAQAAAFVSRPLQQPAFK